LAQAISKPFPASTLTFHTALPDTPIEWLGRHQVAISAVETSEHLSCCSLHWPLLLQI